MERLTMRNGELRLAIPKEAYENYQGDRPLDCSSFCDTQIDCLDCPIGQCFDKLALYEDTGLQPEELDPDIIQNAYDELAEYEVAEEEGRLLKLPFRMTQEVYTIFNGKVVKGQFAGVYFRGIDTWFAYDHVDYDVCYNGKIIHAEGLFETEEEAMMKLKELEEAEDE